MGYRAAPWTERVREALTRQHADVSYLNLGLRNLVAAEVRAQQLDRALAFAPDLAAVVCGGNDLLGPRFDPDSGGDRPRRDGGVIAGGRRGCGDLRPDGHRPCHQGAGPGPAPHADPQRAHPRRLARHDALLVDMWEHPACPSRDMYSSDMLHSSMRGHALLAAQTIRRLGAYQPARRFRERNLAMLMTDGAPDMDSEHVHDTADVDRSRRRRR